MVKEQKKSDILIIGGGVAGLTLAKLLGDQGMNVHLVEPRPPAPFKDTSASSRTVALMQSSLRILGAAGFDDFCREYGTPLNIMRIYDDSTPNKKPIISSFDSFEIGMDGFGLNIPNSLLRAHLYEAVQQNKNITIHETSLKDYSVEGNAHVIAILENDMTIKSPLIIGADGRESTVRNIAGIAAHKKQYDQSALTFIVNHSRAHEFTSTEFHRAGGPFALVPMKGNQCSVVWVDKTENVEKLIKLPKEAFETAVQNATNDVLGGITLETNPQSWPLCAIQAKSLTAPRTALIAEAAHVMSPITAQGLNLSLRDVASLAEVIMDAIRIGSDYGTSVTLRKYERRRSIDIKTRFTGVNGMNQIVSNDLLPIKDLRRAGLKIMDKLSPLKMTAMHIGLAPNLDEGRLMKGEAL